MTALRPQLGHLSANQAHPKAVTPIKLARQSTSDGRDRCWYSDHRQRRLRTLLPGFSAGARLQLHGIICFHMSDLQLKRPLVVTSIMLAIFMVAIEATIVATAMPKIVGDLGGFERYSWVFAAFLLAQTTTTVIYGKLTDLFGRRPVIIVGIIIFLLGSLLCGLATSMTSLVAFRLLQGIGAGAIQPVAMTIVGDLYPLEQRARIQGLIASVWAFSAVTGPLAGGLIVEQLSWSWIFWINIPIGLLTIVGFWFFLQETVARREHHIDYWGAALFSVAMVALIVALTEAGTDRTTMLISAALFVVFFIIFL